MSRSPHIDLAECFYTFPSNVLDALVERLGVETFGAEHVAQERELSAQCGSHAQLVGFDSRGLIQYQALRPMELGQFNDQFVREAGLDPEAVSQALQIYEDDFRRPIQRFRRGYAGWLMVNQEFLDDHDRIFRDHCRAVRVYGTRYLSLMPLEDHPALMPENDNPYSDNAWSAFADDARQLLLKWRLQRLPGPDLPDPIGTLLTGQLPISVIQPLIEVGGAIYLPDIMVIPSADVFRTAVELAIRGRETPLHLQDWFRLCSNDNTARTELDRYGRLFEIQHYFRTLRRRYPHAMHNNLGRIEGALSLALGVSEATIHADHLKIRRALGSDWLDRPWPLGN